MGRGGAEWAWLQEAWLQRCVGVSGAPPTSQPPWLAYRTCDSPPLASPAFQPLLNAAQPTVSAACHRVN